MNQYLIPANSKKNQLLFGLFKPIDLWIFLGGTLASIILLLSISDTSSGSLIIKLLPILCATLSVVPIPNYHNVRTFITEAIMFYVNQRRYYWKGWCVKNEYSEYTENANK